MLFQTWRILEAFRLALTYIFLSSFMSTEQKRRSSKEKTASGGFSCFAVATLGPKHHTCPKSRLPSCRRLSRNTKHLMQNGISHFKHVYLVGEKQIELHIASDSAIFFLPNPAWHLGRKVELWVKHNLN